MGKSRKSTIRKFEFYETITDNGIESGYVRLANTQFHSDAVIINLFLTLAHAH